jgi:type II secretory pathway component PulK
MNPRQTILLRHDSPVGSAVVSVLIVVALLSMVMVGLLQ